MFDTYVGFRKTYFKGFIDFLKFMILIPKQEGRNSSIYGVSVFLGSPICKNISSK